MSNAEFEINTISKNITFFEEYSFIYQLNNIASKYTCAITNSDNKFYLFWYTYTNNGIHVKYIKNFRPNILMKYRLLLSIFIKYNKRKFINDLNLINSITKKWDNNGTNNW